MNQLAMFAKYWDPGSVKTRLAATIGDVAASRIYFHCLDSLVHRFDNLAENRTLVFWPPDRAADFATVARGRWQLAPQAAGHLGRRMGQYFSTAFEQGATHVVLIGSDSPTVPGSWILRSWQMLQRVNVVLGPSTDGGYYLVGMSQFVPAIFDDIRWSTPHVLEDTKSRIAEEHLSYAELPTWYDIDEIDDLYRLRHELVDQQPEDADWTELLAAIDDGIRRVKNGD